MRCTAITIVLSVILLSSCMTESQVEDFVRRNDPPQSNIVFSEDFENGLGQWSQTSGIWTISNTGGVSGNYLQSGTSATPATFTIATINSLNLTGKTNCVLDYDVRFLIKSVSGVSATVKFDTTVVGNFKDTSGLTDITSSTAFVKRRVHLPDNGLGRLSITTTVTNDTTGYADLRIDNVLLTCGNVPLTSAELAYDNLNTSAANWSLQSPWIWSASAGYTGSGALQMPAGVTGGSGNGGNWSATFLPTLNLTNRFGCRLEFYYSMSAAANNCLYAEINSTRIWTLCGMNSTGNLSTLLTAFEGVSSNSLAFRCVDTNVSGGGFITCTLDEIKVTCQQ